jgi:hypothetical protein
MATTRKSVAENIEQATAKRQKTQEREQRLKRKEEDEKELIRLTYSIVHLRNFTWPTEWRHLDLTGRLDMLYQRILNRVHSFTNILRSGSISDFEGNRQVWAIVSGTDLCTWHSSDISITLCLQYIGDRADSKLFALELTDVHWKRWAGRMDRVLPGATFEASLKPCFSFRSAASQDDPEMKILQGMLTMHHCDMRVHDVRLPANWREEECWLEQD